MEKFFATKKSNDNLELQNPEDIEKLFKNIEEDDNFILVWNEGDVQKSELIIATNISAKIKNGEIKLTSQKAGGK